MADIAELDTALDTIEASLIYLADTGEKLVTQVADPGGRDQRQGGGNETHRVKILNGRPLAARFDFEREGFRFVGDKSLSAIRARYGISTTRTRSAASTTQNVRR